MKFNYDDVLTLTTGRLVSRRHMDAVYEMLNFLTGDSIYTHQIPRVMREVEPWLRDALAPKWFPEHHQMKVLLDELTTMCAADAAEQRSLTVADWLRKAKEVLYLPDAVDLEPMEREAHLYIDPIEEAKAMMGDDKVIVVQP